MSPKLYAPTIVVKEVGRGTSRSVLLKSVRQFLKLGGVNAAGDCVHAGATRVQVSRDSLK